MLKPLRMKWGKIATILETESISQRLARFEQSRDEMRRTAPLVLWEGGYKIFAQIDKGAIIAEMFRRNDAAALAAIARTRADA